MIDVLIGKLDSTVDTDKYLVDPCLVPVLTLMARLGQGRQHEDAKLHARISQCVSNFVGSTVMAVR